MYCSGSILTPLISRYPHLITWGPRLGIVMCAGSLFLSSYATKAWQLFLSQGILYSIGSSLAYYPGLVFLSEWWIERRGFAGGVMFTGASVFGLIYPPIMDWALGRYGMPVTFRGMSLAWLICVVPILPFYHGRLNQSTPAKKKKMRMMTYLSRPITWILLLSNFLQSLAYFVPIVYIPSFAKSIGHSGGIYLGIFSGTSIFGQMVIGTLSDYWDVSWLIGITSVASAASILGLWRFCNGILMLASFTTVYGITAGGYSCLWQRFGNLIDPEDSSPANLMVIFVTCRGIANIATGPIAGTLLSSASSETDGYHILMYYSGVLMLLSSFGMVCYFFKRKAYKV